MSDHSAASPSPPPKHRLVCEELRRRILSGEYPPGSKLPTETQLPDLLGAGKQTVVRALNELVLEGLIVRKRGSGSFVSPSRLRSFLKGRHLRIGVLWHKSVNPVRMRDWFQGDIVRGLMEGLELSGAADLETRWPRERSGVATRAEWSSRSRGVSVVCLGEPTETFLRHPPLDAVREGRFDALVVLSILEPAFLRTLKDLGVPLVLADVHDEAVGEDLAHADHVFVDPGHAYRATVAHLAAQGLRRIHFVAEYITASSPRQEDDAKPELPRMRLDPESFARYTAFLQGMEACGLKVAPEHAHFADEQIDALVHRLAALPPERRPEAFVCHGFTKAHILIQEMRKAGLAVQAAGTSHRPEQGAAHTIVADGLAIGRTVAELLSSRLQRPDRGTLRVGVPMRFEAAVDSSSRAAV